MPKRLLVLGHSLAAIENHAPFYFMPDFHIDLLAPKTWRARTLGTIYRNSENELRFGKNSGSIQNHILPVLGNGWNSLFLWLGLSPLIKRLKPDLIYCWEEPWCLATFQVGRIAKKLNVPILFFSAENRHKSLPWLFRNIQIYIYKQSSACCVPTRQIAHRVRSSGFLGPIFEIPLWILPRTILAVSPQDQVLVYVGRLIPLKRVHVLIEALCVLPGFKLRIIGNGPEKRKLIDLTRKFGLTDRVEFLGHVNHLELSKAINGAALLILPTGENQRQAEQFGKAALEGLAHGLPVLTSRTGNLLELSLSFSTLFARDLDSPQQIASAIMEIWNNFPGSTVLESTRIQVFNHYSPEHIGALMQTAFLNPILERQLD